MAARLALAGTLTLGLLASSDGPRTTPMDQLPRLVLWAWERPVDLRGLPPGVGVAFLAHTITATARASVVLPRRQPLLGTRSSGAGLSSPALAVAGSLFEASVDLRLPDGRSERWHIRQDSLIWPGE